MKKEITQRDEHIDIIKALAIILMVYGHTFGSIRNFVYLFHMPLFFMVSGYCWKSKHSSSKESRSIYIINRFKRLMIPLYVSYFMVSLLRNLFVYLGFYTTAPEFVEVTRSAPIGQYNVGIIGVRDVIFTSYQSLCFKYVPPQLAGPIWFLYALFAVCLIHCILDYLINKINKVHVQIIVWSIVFILFCVIAWAVSVGYVSEDYEIRHRRLFAAYVCYLLGVFLKDVGYSRLKGIPLFGVGLVSLAILIIMQQVGTLELSSGSIINPLFLISCSLCGWAFLYAVAHCINLLRIKYFFSFIGKRTLSIVILHLFAFKLMSYVLILIQKKPFYMVASYPIIFDVSELVKIVYTVIGVAIPLLVDVLITKCKYTYFTK